MKCRKYLKKWKPGNLVKTQMNSRYQEVWSYGKCCRRKRWSTRSSSVYLMNTYRRKAKEVTWRQSNGMFQYSWNLQFCFLVLFETFAFLGQDNCFSLQLLISKLGLIVLLFNHFLGCLCDLRWEHLLTVQQSNSSWPGPFCRSIAVVSKVSSTYW